jgi:transposase InsO family protein
MLSKEYPVSFLCRVHEQSRSGYYDWKSRGESERVKADKTLLSKIRVIHGESRETYGSPRVHEELKKQGIKCGKTRVERLMKSNGISSVHRRKYRVQTTDSNHSNPISDNIIEQDFSTTGRNQKWGSDITYIKTNQGWIYLAVVIDFYSRKVVGYAIGESMETWLICKALQMAHLRRGMPTDLIHHSDRGVQYASQQYRSLLTKFEFRQSMSRKGNCYDNALVESFFHTLKVEHVYRYDFDNLDQAKQSIVDYIENFYNKKRSHSALDYVSPVDFELKDMAA